MNAKTNHLADRIAYLENENRELMDRLSDELDENRVLWELIAILRKAQEK